MISIVVPVLNEAEGIISFLSPLQKYRHHEIEIILVDGGSQDDTVKLAKPFCDVIESSQKGRANQMNAGAKKAQGNIFLFLHADTLMPEGFPTLIEKKLHQHTAVWGRFDVRLSGVSPSLRLIEFFMNIRSKWTGIATGDQAIFVQADVFHHLKGYEEISLMEDIALSKKLKKITKPACLREKVITSSRRWESFGIWRTIMLMWRLRFAYFMGVDPEQLVKKYK